MDKVVNKTLKLGYYYYSLVKICGILWSVDMEATSRIVFSATPSIRGNPTAEHAGGNACVVSSQDNVGNPRTQLRSTARIRTL